MVDEEYNEDDLDDEEIDDNEYNEDDFDDEENMSETLDHHSQRAMSTLMASIVEATNHRMTLTNELTKLVVNKNPDRMGAKEVFAVFKEAAAVIAETYPLKGFMDKDI